MTHRSSLATVIIAGAMSLGATALALAHGPGGPYGGQSSGYPGGWGAGQTMGPGMMGQGMGPGMMGPGMMGQGMGPGMMGPGMMGQGMGPGMMGHGMMGQGMGPGMMGHGMMSQGMGPGMMGPGMMQPLRSDLSADDVKHMMGHRLAWMGNPNIKLGAIEERDADTIVAEIVTQDGSLVQRFEVDRHTGWMQPAQ